MTFQAMSPMLMVRDLKETLDFYTSVLGFEVTGTYPEGDQPTWAAVTEGDIRVMFSWVGEPHAHDDGEEHSHTPEFNGALYFTPGGPIADFHTRVKAKVPACGDLLTQPWGMTEFAVTDPNGYTLLFGVPTDE
jgi:lactoylglutathione lyase